jgi:tetratricopeptide (TPR) repeat protein
MLNMSVSHVLKCLLIPSVLILSACASVTVLKPQAELFNDPLFANKITLPGPDDIFKTDASMKAFIAKEIEPEIKYVGAQLALHNALGDNARLKIEYNASFTPTAVEAFHSRSGNCLSLIILAAAFAKELGLPIHYQNVISKNEDWTRSNGLYINSGHVNLLVGKGRTDNITGGELHRKVLIDFLPPDEAAMTRTVGVEENTIVAMYMNNRAGEALARNQVDQAYWWASGAIKTDLQFAYAYNTLGAIYMRKNQFELAEKSIRIAMQLDPKNTANISNLISVLNTLGRTGEAGHLQEKLRRDFPTPPFYFFNLGMQAMGKNEFLNAKLLFIKEIKHAPQYHESHFWLGIAHLRLGEIEAAQKELAIAKESSTTPKDFALYSAKLDHLKTQNRQ